MSASTKHGAGGNYVVDKKDKRWMALKKSFMHPDAETLQVGVFPDKNRRYAMRARSEGRIGNATAAFFSEFGAKIPQPNGSVVIIPRRPFLSRSFKNNQAKYVKFAKSYFFKIASRSRWTAKSALKKLGKMIVSDTRKFLVTGKKLKRLSGSTLKARRAKGNPDKRPLMDSGQLYHAIDYKVE